ncbi:MAG: sulfite exporter TauE/SafE family protein [Ferruginibacter sp.]
MIALITTAIILGALGSAHCIGMCGPIALSLPVVAENHYSKFLGALLYNAGRVLTYACIGLLFGLAGKSFSLFGFQQILSVSLGVIIILFLIFPPKKNLLTQNKHIASFFADIRNKIGILFTKRNYSSLFMIGLLNGLLPCGLVYLAIAGAVATGDPLKSSVFMASFGLGTLPLMWAVAFFGSFINLHTRKILNKAYPYMMGIMACLLIIRGLGLNIPYISPAHSNETSTVIECHN